MAASKRKQTTVIQDYAVCHLAVIPIRKRPEDAAEMVSQLLFGEWVTLIQKKNKSWVKIKSLFDHYEGWIDPKQVLWGDEKMFQKLNHHTGISLDLSSSLTHDDKSYPIVIGSSLPGFDGISFKLPDGKYIYNGQAVLPDGQVASTDMLLKIARKFINAPYLWGGRSPFGIDCSGFTQVVFKILGFALPRDAYQQVEWGEVVDFVELSREGDLAFFENKEGRIHHVGIIMGEGSIIHASGRVRIDRLDHEGIYNEEMRRYTHRLKVIKRLF